MEGSAWGVGVGRGSGADGSSGVIITHKAADVLQVLPASLLAYAGWATQVFSRPLAT